MMMTVIQRWGHSQHIFMMMSKISHSWKGEEPLGDRWPSPGTMAGLGCALVSL